MKIQPLSRSHRVARGSAATQLAAGLAVLTIALLCGCATAPSEEELPSAESYYQRGIETLKGRTVFFFFDDVDYPKAIEAFQGSVGLPADGHPGKRVYEALKSGTAVSYTHLTLPTICSV